MDFIEFRIVEMNNQYLEDLEITKIDNVFVCNNCGAFVIHKLKNMVHFPNCQKGESKKWEEYYSQKDEEEES